MFSNRLSHTVYFNLFIKKLQTENKVSGKNNSGVPKSAAVNREELRQHRRPKKKTSCGLKNSEAKNC